MNTQFSQNVQPPAGWTVPTYIDATGNVQVGHSFSSIWPFSVYPPLPPGHPATLPPGLPHTVTGPAHASQTSPPPPSSNQSPADNAVGLAPLYTPSTSSSHAPPASWSQPYAGSIYPPLFPQQWYSMYAGYYYPYVHQVQGSVYPPAVLPMPPLNNDVANVPPTVQRHSSVSSKASNTTTPPPPKEDAHCHEQPTSVAALPATYEFTFKCSPQLDLQQCCSSHPVQDPHEHTHDSLLKDSGVDDPFLPPSAFAQENSEVPFDDMDTFQSILDAMMYQEAHCFTQQETSTLPYDAQPAQDDEAAAQLILSVLMGQDAPGDITPCVSPQLPSCPSPAPSTSSAQTQMSGSTLVSTWSVSGSSSPTGSPSLPCALPPHQGMFWARPSAQSTSGQKGKKRSMETENPAPTADSPEPKRRRVTPEGSEDKKYWCTKCSDYVAENRRQLHETSRKHSGRAMFSCRICHRLGIDTNGHSRKDSLKRHIIQQHEQQYGPVWQTFPQLLEPSAEVEDLGYLHLVLASRPPQ